MIKKSTSIGKYIVTFLLLLPLWLLLSGHYDLFHIGIGILCCALVSLFSAGLLFTSANITTHHIVMGRFILYIPWLIYQIILANILVAKLVLSPKLKIEPQVFSFKSKLKSDVAQTTYGNSITLTPGTITIDIKDDEVYVHALAGNFKDDLLTGEMERRISKIFQS
ncbi:MAG: Na+/H+ antiporter subunit E [Pseudomonadota bacterium]|nr:Na+/H+ antiporter subunit E [Pseudomonadota bacterium]